MSMAEYFRMKEAEAIAEAKRYERCPEDLQKAAGAREARRMAAFFRQQAEIAELEESEGLV
jgi:hypothetical protein